MALLGISKTSILDTRTQANLSKLINANPGQDLDIITKSMSEIMEKGPKSGQLIPSPILGINLLLIHNHAKNM